MPMFHNKKNFFNAVRAGDAEAVAQYLTYYIPLKFDIDVQDEKGMTALNLAARAGDVRIINMLLGSGADPDLPSRDGDAPLISALNEKKPNAALALLEGGAKPNTHSNDYVYPIHLAAFAGDLDVVQALVTAKADLDVLIRANGRTALHWAVEKEMTSVVDCLAKAGARTDIVDKAGKTVLDLAKTKPYLLKVLQKSTTAPSAAPAPAPAAATDTGQNSESWSRLGDTRVAHTGVYTDIGRKITEIFNFEARERTVISENLKTGAETLSPPESFDRVNEEALKKAFSEFRRLGGNAEESTVLGTRPPKKAFNL